MSTGRTMLCPECLKMAEEDFRQQKCELQETLEACGQVVLFLPKFHCELNPIEPYWCQAKWYCRENCDYTFSRLCETVPKSLASVKDSSIEGIGRGLIELLMPISRERPMGLRHSRTLYINLTGGLKIRRNGDQIKPSLASRVIT